MKKIKLELEELKIDSFEITKSNQEKGTVKGFETDAPSGIMTCEGSTCYKTCDGNCGVTSLITCGVI